MQEKFEMGMISELKILSRTNSKETKTT